MSERCDQRVKKERLAATELEQELLVELNYIHVSILGVLSSKFNGQSSMVNVQWSMFNVI